MWYVTEKEDDPFFPKYYYRCPICLTFSAPQIYFPQDKYVSLPIDFYGKGELTDSLTSLRVESLRNAIGGDLLGAVLLDLGSGGGWLSKRFVHDIPDGEAFAVEVDTRLRDAYYLDEPRIRFVPMLIDDFLAVFGEEVNAHTRVGADVVIMTDVLEHLVYPDRTIELVFNALRQGGVGYFVVPNSRTFQHPDPYPVSDTAVDWRHAKHTCQHIWTMSPQAFEGMFVAAGFTVLAHDQDVETTVRRDGVYSTVIVRR
jgi:SAM-dependent methyltransferase